MAAVLAFVSVSGCAGPGRFSLFDAAAVSAQAERDNFPTAAQAGIVSRNLD